VNERDVVDKELYNEPDLLDLIHEWWKDRRVRVLGVRLFRDLRGWPPVFRCDYCQPTCVLASIYSDRVDVWTRARIASRYSETLHPEDPDFFEKLTKALERSRKECYGRRN
jgi:hypothetical protein